MFTADYKERLPEDKGKVIVEKGTYLGRSQYDKDCCWECYEFSGSFFISLNGEGSAVWLVDKEDVDLYNEVSSS